MLEYQRNKNENHPNKKPNKISIGSWEKSCQRTNWNVQNCSFSRETCRIFFLLNIDLLADIDNESIKIKIRKNTLFL